MEESTFFYRLLDLLHAQPVLTLFLILGMGYVIGAIRIGSFSLGPVAGVLFAGLFLGHFGFTMSPGAQAVGFALFIFSVGYQAGPSFFDVLKTDGLRYFLLSLVVAVSGFIVAVIASNLFSFAPGTSAGILSGGLTSSPTLAAAQEALRSGQVTPAEGYTADDMIGNVATGYAITYIFGLAGLITILKLMPKILGIDLAQEAKKLEQTIHDNSNVRPDNISARVYLVTNESVTKLTREELKTKFWDKTSVVRIKRDGILIDMEKFDGFKMNDEVYILAPVEYFTDTLSKVHLGIELAPEVSTAQYTSPAQIVIINHDVTGKTIGELQVAEKFHVLLTGLKRMHFDIPNHSISDTELKKGDILMVTGSEDSVNALGKELGHVERDVAETDMVTFAFGIAFGVVIGLFAVNIGQVSIGLGSAGGLLASGLLIGYLRSIKPTFGRMPDAARWILMEFGLLLFMAGVGLRAGSDIIDTLMSAGPVLVLAGICVTVIPIMIGFLCGSKILKIHPVLLFGGITGAMTSGASLSVVTKQAKSYMPSLGYTGSYAFSNVLLTVAGSIILFI